MTRSAPTLADPETRSLHSRLIGLVAGLAVFAVTLTLSPPEGMSPAAWRVAGVAAMMAVWWVSEALPIPVTALSPVIFFPLLGVSSITEAAAPYANPLIFLFLGGFMIALALERWNLHRRIALNILHRSGARPAALVAGFLVATACLSMWLSNTATAVMMLPIALSVIGLLHQEAVATLPPQEDRNFAICLLLSIAYGASIGGLGTLIGTPPNALLAAYVAKTYGIEIGFGEWMLVGVPLVIVMLPLAWLILTRLAFPIRRTTIAGAEAVIANELKACGPMTSQEKSVAAVFGATAALWILRPVIDKLVPELSLSDPTIALLGAFSLFVIPANLSRGEFLLDWSWAKRLPWGVIILFGGGLSLASAIGESGLAEWISQVMTGADGLPRLVIVILITSIVVFLTEITSNTATASVFLPIVAAFAALTGIDPFLLLAPVALAASCAFMMPVATPPNAIVFASGRISVPQMVRAGLALNVAAILLIVAFSYTLVLAVFGVELSG